MSGLCEGMGKPDAMGGLRSGSPTHAVAPSLACPKAWDEPNGPHNEHHER